MAKRVREPIQVYLTSAERAELDRAANELGVSHSEALRRGIRALSSTSDAGPFRDLAAGSYLTLPTTGPGVAPPSAPVACLKDLLAELAEDRADR